MAVRLDPFKNITGVHWRTEEPTEGTEEPYPEPEYFCTFIAGASSYGGTSYHGYSTDAAIAMGSIVENSEGTGAFVTRDIALRGIVESVSTRGEFAGMAPASLIEFSFGLSATLPGGSDPDIRGMLDGKYIVMNGIPIFPQFFMDGDARPYPGFSDSSVSDYPSTYGPLRHHLGGEPTTMGARGDSDPPGGRFGLGLAEGVSYKVWLQDSLD